MNDGKKWFNPKNFEDLIMRFNPFGFKQTNGDTCAFKDYGEVYLYTLNTLYQMFPRGYVDIPLWLCEMTRMPLVECRRVVRTWRSMGIDREEITVALWDDCPERNYTLEHLMRALHTISGTIFSSSYFADAMRKFDEENKILARDEKAGYEK